MEENVQKNWTTHPTEREEYSSRSRTENKLIKKGEWRRTPAAATNKEKEGRKKSHLKSTPYFTAGVTESRAPRPPSSDHLHPHHEQIKQNDWSVKLTLIEQYSKLLKKVRRIRWSIYILP